MQDMRSAWRSMRDEMRSMPLEPYTQGPEGEAAASASLASSAPSVPSSAPDDGNFERHLRGQVCS